ncbi:MAG: glycosyltransferase [Oligoflexales bacterium]|nr:glycosyltransferase [Oligoflexales bacterium]
MSRATIIIPCYNEEKRLPQENFVEFMKSHPHIQFLFVNDGSTDGTMDLIKSLSARCPQASYLNLQKNIGKAEAVRLGVLKALKMEAPYVGYWDADLATPLDEIPKFLRVFQEIPHLELVMGTRIMLLGRKIERPFVRHVLSRIFASFASSVLQLPVYDTQCGAKLFFVSPKFASIFSKPFLSRWIFDVEILSRMGTPQETINTVFELPLSSWQDVDDSRVKVKDFFNAISELFKIYRQRNKNS